MKSSLALLMALVAGSLLAADSATKQPNIIFVLADDLGYGDIGCYGQKKIQTPCLDRMAAEGMQFTQFYAGSTVCAPSRCVLMTGLDTGHCLIRGNARVPLRPQDVTVAKMLKDTGYATGLIGKWGLGEAESTGVPTRQGFDSFFGYLSQVHAHNYYPAFLWRNEQRVTLKNVVPEGIRGEFGQGWATKKVEYSHDLFASESLQWIENHKGGPFFLYLAFTIPHANNEGMQATKNGQEVPDLGIYKDKDWPEPSKGYAAMVTRMDADLGRMFALLKRLGMDDNTLVLFTSDNGPQKEGGNPPTFFESGGPLRGIKRDLYEGGIREPLIARWPGRIRAGTVSDHVGYFGDFFATAAELSGAQPPPGLDSISFLPMLLGQAEKQKTHEYLYWEFHEGGFKQAVRMGDWKAVRLGVGKPLEVFNLKVDLGEQTDVAAQHPEIVARMEAILKTARTDSPDWPVKSGNPSKPKKGEIMKSFLVTIVAAIGLGSMQETLLAVESRRPTPPNVLFILVDDYGIKDVGVEGSTFYETPHIDELGRTGMRFTQGYAACPVCSPSRASILLGKYPPRHGITDYIGAAVGEVFAKQRHVKLLVPDYVRNLPAADTTLAQALKQAGYCTFFAGKWHLGSKGSWPEDHGFDINKGGWDAGSPAGGYYSPWQNPTLPNGPPGESLTRRLASETISFIEQHKDRPFLAYLSFYAVHAPIQTTKPLWSKYREKAARQPFPAERFKIDRTLPVRQFQDNPVYAGLIEEMDTAVGQVLTRLEDLGLADRTVVCFTSDNGGVTSGDCYSSSQLPYRGGKGRQWEGGLRVPFYIKAPGVTRPGSTCDTPVVGTDFYPTILQLVGLPLRPEQHVDGVSLAPLLKGGTIAARPLFWHYPHYGNQGGEPSSIIRNGDWKLIHYWEDNRNELYHLPNDIGEQHDLAKQEAVRTAQLWAELQAWLKETDAKIPQPYAQYQEAWGEQQRTAAQALKTRLEKAHAAYLDPGWQPDPTWWKSLVPVD